MPKKWFLAAALAAATPAAAHDWYPMECCHAMDCAPVDKVEMLPGPSIASMLSTPAQADSVGGMLVTTRHGSVIVPANFPRRESKDNRMHACMRRGGGSLHASVLPQRGGQAPALRATSRRGASPHDGDACGLHASCACA